MRTNSTSTQKIHKLGKAQKSSDLSFFVFRFELGRRVYFWKTVHTSKEVIQANIVTAIAINLSDYFKVKHTIKGPTNVTKAKHLTFRTVDMTLRECRLFLTHAAKCSSELTHLRILWPSQNKLSFQDQIGRRNMPKSEHFCAFHSLCTFLWKANLSSCTKERVTFVLNGIWLNCFHIIKCTSWGFNLTPKPTLNIQ